MVPFALDFPLRSPRGLTLRAEKEGRPCPRTVARRLADQRAKVITESKRSAVAGYGAANKLSC